MNNAQNSAPQDASQPSEKAPVPAAPVVTDKHPHQNNLDAKRGYKTLYAFTLLLVGVLIAQGWYFYHELHVLRIQVAKRMQSTDNAHEETHSIVKSVQEPLAEIRSRVGMLEGKQLEVQGQQLALEQLYQRFSKRRDDGLLAEIEQVLSTASQQLQLSGNVESTLIALQNVDARLAEMPQWVSIRRAIGHDIERLKALPTLDMVDMALRLDGIINQIDSMPLLSDEKILPQDEKPHTLALAAQKKETVPENAHWRDIWQARWHRFSSELWGDIHQLVRIREVGTSDALLLLPAQTYFVRENLKLRLLNARLALLSRNERVFRSDMTATQEAIARYFDPAAKETRAAQETLKRMQSSHLAIDMPTLAESLAAVRKHKAQQ